MIRANIFRYILVFKSYSPSLTITLDRQQMKTRDGETARILKGVCVWFQEFVWAVVKYRKGSLAHFGQRRVQWHTHTHTHAHMHTLSNPSHPRPPPPRRQHRQFVRWHSLSPQQRRDITHTWHIAASPFSDVLHPLTIPAWEKERKRGKSYVWKSRWCGNITV